MEIKQGDKVRVSKDAPMLYTEGCIDWEAAESTVGRIDGDAAEIDYINEDNDELYSIVIPCKYLVKVDTEAKEARYIFYGDYAKMASESLEELKRKTYPEWYSSTEPKEQTEEEEEPCVGRINFAERMKRQKEAHQAIVDEFSSRSFDWDTYTADLAREIALKVANRYNSPEETAEYAAKAAKQIVKHLKENI